MSGLIQSQGNARQGATEAGTQHSRSVLEQSSGSRSLYHGQHEGGRAQAGGAGVEWPRPLVAWGSGRRRQGLKYARNSAEGNKPPQDQSRIAVTSVWETGSGGTK